MVRKLAASFLLPIGLACSSVALLGQASASPSARRAALSPYFATQPVTRLDWELLQFNMLWHDSFDGEINYVTSYPIVFDAKQMRFRALLGVTDRRDSQDPEPFFGLSDIRKRSILQGAIDHLLDLLSNSFPEVRKRPDLLYAEFVWRSGSAGAGPVVVANFENGQLTLTK